MRTSSTVSSSPLPLAGAASLGALGLVVGAALVMRSTPSRAPTPLRPIEPPARTLSPAAGHAPPPSSLLAPSPHRPSRDATATTLAPTVVTVSNHRRESRGATGPAQRGEEQTWSCGAWEPLASGPVGQRVRYCGSTTAGRVSPVRPAEPVGARAAVARP